MKKVLKVLIFLFIIGCLAFFIMFQHISAYSRSARPAKSDVIIVLGCQIWGREPSPSLEYRLQQALDLYREKYGEYIIVSGGKGKDEETFESEVMKTWLAKKGVEPDRIIEERESTSTYENLKFSKEIMDARSFKSAVVVTNDFHLFRSVKIAKKLGIQATGSAAPSVAHLKTQYLCREVLSVVKTFLLDF